MTKNNKSINDKNNEQEINMESSISKWKDIFTIIQSIFTVLGILGALIWFYQQGDVRPRAIVSHEVTHRQIDEKRTWLHASVKITNIGKIPIKIEKKSGMVWVQKISKELNENILCDKNSCVVPWPPACADYKHELTEDLTIEPGETDRKSYEFIISPNVKTVKVYSYFDNPLTSWQFWKKAERTGWDEVTIYDLKEKSGGT